MYNPETIYVGRNGFLFSEASVPDDFNDEATTVDLTQEIFTEDDSDIESLLEGEAFEEDFPDDEAFDDDESFEESDLSFLDDDTSLTRITSEINRDVSRMNESEAIDYMEDRMEEFWPALIAALPTIIDMAPKAIDAVSSLFKKDPPKPSQPAPTPPAPTANVPPTPVATTKPVPIPTPKPTPAPMPAPNPAAIAPAPAPISDADSPAVLKVLTDLIQSPKLQEMLAGMLSGKSATMTGNSGQGINGSNVLGVISSLAGALAGTAAKESTESIFPEYALSAEGTFVIDPHNSLQEGQLILNMIH
jgi:hypothetical protein